MDFEEEIRKAGVFTQEIGQLLIRVTANDEGNECHELLYQYTSLKQLAEILKGIFELVDTLANVTLVAPMFQPSQEKHGV